MASQRVDKVARLLNEEGLACLLNGADAEATQCFIEYFICGETPRDFDNGNLTCDANCFIFKSILKLTDEQSSDSEQDSSEEEETSNLGEN